MIVVAVILIIIAFLSLFYDTGYLRKPQIFPVILDVLLFIFALIVLVRSIILYKIGEKEMLSKKVRELEAKVDFLTKKLEESMKFLKAGFREDHEMISQKEVKK